jgi:hypothetical protein
MRKFIINENVLQALGDYFTQQSWRVADPFLKELAKCELLPENKSQEVTENGKDTSNI